MAKKSQAEMIGLYAGLLVQRAVEYEDMIAPGSNYVRANETEQELRSLCSQLRNLVAELVFTGINMEGNEDL
tara:strand:- start:1579 stop:1794 length:216 start_codon:yes stop_codon:yes gene_type:complete